MYFPNGFIPLNDVGGLIALNDIGAMIVGFFATGSLELSLVEVLPAEEVFFVSAPSIGGIAIGLAGVSANGTEQNVGCSSS